MALIVIEGLDGAGKSTQIKLLADYFSRKGINNRYLHFPRTDSPFFGDMIARFLRGELGDVNQVDPYVIALLYAGDRFDASRMMNDWLAKGDSVILDRYVYSNIAFQCAKYNNSEKQAKLRQWIFDLEYSYYGIPKPDLSIFLDVPFSFTKERLTESRKGDDRDYLQGKEDIHEKDLSFQEQVRLVYLEQQNYDPNFKVVKCYNEAFLMKKPGEIFGLIIDEVEKINL